MAKKAKKKSHGVKVTPPRPNLNPNTNSKSVDDKEAPKIHGRSTAEEARGLDLKGGCSPVGQPFCRHLEKGVNIEKLSSQITKPKVSLSRCQACIKASDLGSKKKKGKAKKKELSALQEARGDRVIDRWVCLACGHIGCSSSNSVLAINAKEGILAGEDAVVGEGHALQHSFLSNHALAVQYTPGRLLCYCFLCKAVSDRSGLEDAAVASSPSSSLLSLQCAMKIVQEKGIRESLSKKSNNNNSKEEDEREKEKEREESVETCSNHCNNSALITTPSGTRLVKGLANLGNTCFFNSVTQNLLSLSAPRSFFLRECPSGAGVGPLTSCLRNLYLETSLDGNARTHSEPSPTGSGSGFKSGAKSRVSWEGSSLGGVFNPRSLFAAICAKAPRFRGFQQQDSHELLRSLLDGLHMEEQSLRAAVMKSPLSAKPDSNGGLQEAIPSSPQDRGRSAASTFVEQCFGGCLSSTICCRECGYSSVVHEPFLDLSLQIPMKQQGKKAERIIGPKGRTEAKPSSPLPKNNEKRKSVVRNDSGKQIIEEAASSSSSGGLLLLPDCTETVQEGPAEEALCDPADDSCWMDYLGGGMQSSEGLLQGFENLSLQDNPDGATIEPTHGLAQIDSNCHDDLISSVGQLDTGKQSAKRLEEDLLDQTLPANEVGTEEEETLCHSVDPPENACFRSFEETSGTDKGEELAVSALSTDTIILLPYENLSAREEVPTMGESSDPLEESRRDSNKSQCGIDQHASSSAAVDEGEEGLELEGFSQLFEEEEDYTAAGSMICATNECQEMEEISISIGATFELDTLNDTDDGSVIHRDGLKNVPYSIDIVPMSLEGCLADFTRSELLSGENAWICENCTRKEKEAAVAAAADLNLQRLEKSLNEPLPAAKLSGQNGIMESAETDGPDCQIAANGNSKEVSVDSGVCGNSSCSAEANGSSSHLLANGCSRQSNGYAVPDTVESKPIPTECPADNLSGSSAGGDLNAKRGGVTLNKGKSSEESQKLCDANGGYQPMDVASASVELSSGSSSRKSGMTLRGNKSKKSQAEIEPKPTKVIKREATKRLLISKAPPVLTIHLKRFTQDLRGRLSKLNGHVAFREQLDLRPFLDPKCPDSESCVYRLVGIVEHSGTMRGGHYVAYVSGGVGGPAPSNDHETAAPWYYISDAHVQKSTPRAVLSREAYLLFYERCI